MKLLIQRVTQAQVEVEQKSVAEIGKGYLVLIGINQTDNTPICNRMIEKMLNLRIFSDENDKINLSLLDVNGELLIVSQFTLYADCKKGNRPSFTKAGNPEKANELYEYFIKTLKERIPVVKHGIFGADMKVSLCNDGPFTIMLDSEDIAI